MRKLKFLSSRPDAFVRTGTLFENVFRISTSLRGAAGVEVVAKGVVVVVIVVVDDTVVVGQTYSGHGQPSGQPDWQGHFNRFA